MPGNDYICQLGHMNSRVRLRLICGIFGFSAVAEAFKNIATNRFCNITKERL